MIAHLLLRYKRIKYIIIHCLQDLLEQLFKLFDQDRDQKLIQESWIEFLKERLQ